MSDDVRSAQARQRLKIRRDFGWHFVTYLVVNGLLVFVWSIHGGGFWPVWTLVPWGIGLVFHAWYSFVGGPVAEDEVERELHRHRDGDRDDGQGERRTPSETDRGDGDPTPL